MEKLFGTGLFVFLMGFAQADRYLEGGQAFGQRYGIDPTGLVLWYDQSDTRSYGDVANWYDLSGSGNHGTQAVGGSQASITGANGLAGATRSFDGGADYMGVADDATLNMTAAVTVAAWVMFDVGAAGEDEICGKWGAGGGTANFGAYVLGVNGNEKLFLKVDDVLPGGAAIIDGDTFPTASWQHVVGTYDSSDAFLYRNAVEVATASQAGAIPTSTKILGVGAVQLENDSIDGYWEGNIGSVTIFNRALSAAEVQCLYLADKPRYGGL